MSERTFSAISATQPTTGPPATIALPNTAKTIVIQQLHVPFDGPPIRITEWGFSGDSAAAQQGLVIELVEVNVGATAGTAYRAPYTTLGTAISSGSTTTIVPNSNAGFPGSGNYLASAQREIFAVTAGQGTNSWTITRGVNGTALAAIQANTPILGVNCPPGDMIQDNGSGSQLPSRLAAQLFFDTLNSLPVSGFNFSTQGSPTVTRELNAAPILSPTGPFVVQQPLGRESEVGAGSYVQVRVTTPGTVSTGNVLSYIKWAE